MPTSNRKYKLARELSWRLFGKRITFYLPGIFSYYGLRGKYPAVSVTAGRCELQCDHCRGKVLSSMIPMDTPDQLSKKCMALAEKGCLGVLISGGCDTSGQLPWMKYIAALRQIKCRTSLWISIHSGLIDVPTARALKEAGVDQALIDVIGDDATFQRMYHVKFTVSRIARALDALNQAQLPVVPHIVCGINYGELIGEMQAVAMLCDYEIEQLVIVSLMQLHGTPVHGAKNPEASAVADVISAARLGMPHARLSLGCARQRGSDQLQKLAIDAGVNRMAIPSDEAIAHARDYGLELRFQRTCCSVSPDFSNEHW